MLLCKGQIWLLCNSLDFNLKSEIMKKTEELHEEGREMLEHAMCPHYHTVKKYVRLGHLAIAAATFGMAIAAVCKLGKIHHDVKVLERDLGHRKHHLL